jgi:hypothetical protein
MAHGQNVRDAMLAIGWTKEAWEDAGHGYDPYGDSCRGVWTINPYAKKRTPPVVVAASAPRPTGPRESSHAPPPGPVPPNTLASCLLARWLAPLTANKAPAQTPLLVIGQSAWQPVAATVAASAGSTYPVNFPRLAVHELPTDNTTAMLLRVNAHDKRVINVSLPSVEAAAMLAPSLGRLRAALPQHSLAFYAPAPPEGLPSIPAAVRENYTTVSWAQMHPSLVAEVAASDAARDFNLGDTDKLNTIEASAIQMGFQPRLGLSPGQRMGLEPVPYRDAVLAALAETKAKASYWGATEGDVRDAKRVRLTDFNRGAGIVTTKDHAHFGAFTRA